ncbi:MAG: ACP S-malonyltransferase [Alicyclobacillaceae bacterium]|nr:ACP S-malonyltransferase [Alicyclobacillaceae bacterium]
MVKVALVFPGQGAQYVGMGRELYGRYEAARAVFDEADRVLGYPLSQLCFEGPEDTLRVTYHTQPALLVASVAAYRVLCEVMGAHPTAAVWQPVVAAGHSLGEYTALVAAGSLSFGDAVHLVQQRGRWMDEACPAGQGAMAAVLGMEPSELEIICKHCSEGTQVVELANLNCPGQIVISGSAPAVERAAKIARERGARRVVPLQVSGPFHSSLMRPAADKLAALLDQVEFRPAQIPVAANVDGRLLREPAEIRDALVRQLCAPVRWEDDVRAMLAAGAEAFIEVGPGTVLSGLIKKIGKGIRVFHVEDEASLRETAAGLGARA